MKKKKVLISSYNLDFGGIETSLINLLKNFELKKYDITLVLENKEGAFLEDVPNGIKIIEYKTNTSKNILKRKLINLTNRLKWIIKNFKKYDASICYATYSQACSFLARTSSNNKLIFIHGDYCVQYKNNKKDILRFFNSVKLKKFNHIICVSNESRKKILNYYPNLKQKILTINNLIDYKKILMLSEHKIDLKKDKKKVFTYIGRLDENQKKVSRIIEIANKLKREKNIEFWIIGDGKDRSLYEKTTDKYKLKNVIFLGSQKNPYPYLKASDCLILTSDYEGFPVVYNEAIILEKPIITTVDVTDDYVSIDGNFGYVVPIDIDAIVSTILEVYNKGFTIKKRLNFKDLNRKRLEKIENLMED